MLPSSSLSLFPFIFFLSSISLSNSDKTTLSVESDESPACSDKHACLAMELEAWFASLKDKRTLTQCDNTQQQQLPQTGDNKEDQKRTIFTMASDCNAEGALWQFRYVGAKGKNRIFHGKGKLSFTKNSSPPHGYDYGMKTGRCILLGDGEFADLSGIEGTFKDGVLNGEALLSFHDGRETRTGFVKGVMNGLARRYETAKDKHTNMEMPDKRLYSVGFHRGGRQVGASWELRLDGTKIMTTEEEGSEKRTLVIVPLTNLTRYLAGKLDEEDMLVGAREARLTAIEERNCINVPTFEEVSPDSPSFDFDLEVKSEMRATVAKLVRFFELVADEKTALENHFKPSPDPLDRENAVRIAAIVSKEKGFFNVRTPDGPGRAIYEGSLDDNGTPNGHGTFKVLSLYKRRDMVMANDNSNSTTNNSTTNNNGTLEDGGSNNNVTASDDTRKMDEATLEEYLEQYIPLDQLPFRGATYKTRKISTIRGLSDHGVLSGMVRLTHTDGSTTEGFAVDGVFHGLVRELAPPFTQGRRKRYVKRMAENVVISTGMMGRDEPIKEVTFVASYKSGFLDGPGWKFLVGGCYLFGNFRKTSDFTTNHGGFINQDLRTAYFGRFVDGKMMSGQLTEVIGHREVDGLKVPDFSEPSGVAYRFAQQGGESGQSNEELTDPLVPDITETTWVYVSPTSSLGADVGQGLFAKRDIPDNTVVSYFGGLRYTFDRWNKTLGSVDQDYWIRTEDGEVIYVPEVYGREEGRYRATLGHKINHSFSKWNCMFHTLDHPRFGLIPAARTTEPVAKDTELLCMYEMKFHEGPPWFQELWRKELDNDTVEGPLGHRGRKRGNNNNNNNNNNGTATADPIPVFLTNSTLHREFFAYATTVLKLDPMA